MTIGADSTHFHRQIPEDQIGQSRSVDVGGNDVLKVVGAYTTNIGTNHVQTIGGSRGASIAGSDQLQVSGNVTNQVAGNLGVAVGKAIVIDAGDQITLKAGDSSIILKKDGEITITGKFVDIKEFGRRADQGSKILAN